MRNETRPDSQRAKEFGPEYGYFGAPAAHAFGATRHMHLYGTTRDDFGAIATAFREHALRNPDAQMKKPLTMEQYREAREIVAPFGLFDCSLRSDGAGALIVTRREHARDLKQPPVLIKGFGTYNNTARLVCRRQHGRHGGQESGEAAYAMAGLGPKDVDTAQIYDCFTYMVLTQLEDYGFCKKGEGGAFVVPARCAWAARCRPTRPAASFPKRMSKACCRSSRAPARCGDTYPAERQVRTRRSR